MPARSADRFRFLAACSGAIAVACGAFGAHALRTRLEPRLLEVFETAARYQMYHALALMAVAILLTTSQVMAAAPSEGRPGPHATHDARARLLVASGWAFVVGTVLFSGSLYAMTFSGVRALGAITPLGGVAFIAGWVFLAAAAMRAR